MVFGFNSNRKGYGFGPMPGINKKKVGSIGGGNWDRDPKSNRTDCQPFNFKKQDADYDFKHREESCYKCGKPLAKGAGKRWYHGDQDDLICNDCAKITKHTDISYAGSYVD